MVPSLMKRKPIRRTVSISKSIGSPTSGLPTSFRMTLTALNLCSWPAAKTASTSTRRKRQSRRAADRTRRARHRPYALPDGEPEARIRVWCDVIYKSAETGAEVRP